MDEERVSAGERALGGLVNRAHLVQPDSLPALLAAAGASIGVGDVRLLLVDHAQKVLVPFPPGASGAEAEQSVDGTIAGRAFRRVEVQEVPAAQGGRQVWIPVVDGADRIGVLGATVGVLDELTRARLVQLAGMAAYIVISKSTSGDAFARVARREDMSLPAEMQWSLLPPLTVATDRVVIAASIEPSYDVGGDLVDYSIDGDLVHLAVFDAKGHGFAAGLLSSAAVGTYRNTRRAGGDLPAIARAIEETLAEHFSDAPMVTALLATLDLRDGHLRWIVAGHPPPLLLRFGHVIDVLERAPDPPLGVGLTHQPTVHHEQFEPGDCLLAYTDGVVEARNAAGEQFGVQRLGEFVVRASAEGGPVSETMRRLAKAVLAYQGGFPQDDASQVLLGWRTDFPSRLIP